MRFALLAVTMLFASCGSDHSATTPADATSQTPAASASRSENSSVELSGSFDVGGYRVYLECTGPLEGPSLVYLHGMDGSHLSAQELPLKLTDHARWCAYDRSNAGRSDRVERRRPGSAFARELHALLDAAGEDGPYVLVGASHGGLIAVLYAELYPEDVAGMVLLDGSLPHIPEIYALIPEKDRATEVAATENNPERVEVFATFDEADRMLDQLPDVPVTFMLAVPPTPEEPPTWPIDEIRALDARRAQEFVDRFRDGRLVRVDSPHYMEPVVTAEIAAEIDRVLRLLGDR